MKKNNSEVKTVDAKELAKALNTKSGVRAGAVLPPVLGTGCRTCGLSVKGGTGLA